MASFNNMRFDVLILTLSASLFVAPILAKEYIVGDENGWGPNFDYQTWADGKFFYVGDTLVFNYPQGVHNVLRVDKTGFQDCKPSANVAALTSGNDAITLSSSGKKWYICGFPNHCESLNMKFSITVMSNVESPRSTPALAPASAPDAPNKASSIASFYSKFWVVAIVTVLVMV